MTHASLAISGPQEVDWEPGQHPSVGTLFYYLAPHLSCLLTSFIQAWVGLVSFSSACWALIPEKPYNMLEILSLPMLPQKVWLTNSKLTLKSSGNKCRITSYSSCNPAQHSSIHSSMCHQLKAQLIDYDSHHTNDSNYMGDTDTLSDLEKTSCEMDSPSCTGRRMLPLGQRLRVRGAP